MKDEIKEMIDCISYMSEEERKRQLELSDIYGFGTAYAYYLLEENERLKNGYCGLKVKCNNGECDCTNEEYDEMVQANMKISLLLDDYKSKIDKANEVISSILYSYDERMYEYCDVNYIEELRKLKKELGDE